MHRSQRGLGAAIAPCKAKRPVIHVLAATVPLVGPRVDERACASRREGGANLGRERGRLSVLPVTVAVEPHLGHHQRALPRNAVQARHICGQPLRRLEIDVVGEQVDERELQVLRGRVVDVGHERLRILLAHRVAEARYEALHRAAPEPADDRGGNLVGDREAEDRGVARARADSLAHGVGDLVCAAPIIEVPHVPLGGEADHHSQPMALRLVEQPPRGRRIGAQGVDAVGLHRPEVLGDGLWRRELVAVGVRPEGPVGDSAHVELAVSEEQELAPDGGTKTRHSIAVPVGVAVPVVVGTILSGYGGGSANPLKQPLPRFVPLFAPLCGAQTVRGRHLRRSSFPCRLSRDLPSRPPTATASRDCE